MRNLICIIIVLITIVSLSGQTVPPPEWTVTITVVDESEQVVPGATLSVVFSTFNPQGKRIGTNITGLSDEHGVYRASSVYTGSAGMLFRASKQGYYTTSRPYDLGDNYSVGRYNPQVTLGLKKMSNPIAMYAKRLDSHPPEIGKETGFDLAVGDWVSPYGKGRSTDIIFLWALTQRSRLDYDGKLTVDFPNPGDGIQEFASIPDQIGSDLRSPREAPTNGYLPTVERVNIAHPGVTTRFDYDPNRQYFFRVRTVLDERGNVKSALYGKIYGDFMHIEYFLNPTPNDRNLEFDPNRNLLSGQTPMGP